MDLTIDEAEEVLDGIYHPLNYFENFNSQKFKIWLRIDKWGNKMDHPREEDILAVLEMVQPFVELTYLEEICLQELITLKKLKLIKKR